MWEIARVKHGSALLLRGWVTACVMPSRHLSGLGAVSSNRMGSDKSHGPRRGPELKKKHPSFLLMPNSHKFRKDSKNLNFKIGP